MPRLRGTAPGFAALAIITGSMVIANHADGRVLVVAQGPRAACQKLLQLLQGDTTPGRVAKVVADWSQSTEQITGFSER